MTIPEQYRRKLPHIQPKDAILFITFRLKGTLPSHLMQQLNEGREKLLKDTLLNKSAWSIAENEYYEAIDTILDSATFGSVWLKDPLVASIVAQSLHFLDGKEFKLICYCIMSNHVHFIAYKFENPAFKIMNSLKTFTAREINKVLKRSGALRQREYYDRVVRDRNDLSKKIEYVINNPVKINLASNWKEWKFTYCHPDFM